jgi:hypothetical protein
VVSALSRTTLVQPEREVAEQPGIRRVGRTIEEHEGDREASEKERDEADEPDQKTHRKYAHADVDIGQSSLL